MDGIFSALEWMDGKGKMFNEILDDIQKENSSLCPLRTGVLSDVHTTAGIKEQVFLALERVHEADYLFGDVQDRV